MSQCSNCSSIVRPIVAVDIDGTISEYHRHLGKHIERYWGRMLPYEPWDGQGNYEDYLGVTQAEYREAKLAFRQGGFKRWSPYMEGLPWFLSAMSSQRTKPEGVEIWITTTRPWNRLDSTDPDTRYWLDRHFPIYDHLLYHDNKYERLADIVDPGRVVAVLEDLPPKYEEAVRTFGQSVPLLMSRPHNAHYRETQGVAGVQDLKAAVPLVEEAIAQWKESQ